MYFHIVTILKKLYYYFDYCLDIYAHSILQYILNHIPPLFMAHKKATSTNIFNLHDPKTNSTPFKLHHPHHPRTNSTLKMSPLPHISLFNPQ